MTKEEIVQGLYRGDSKAIKEAIKALEQQPTSDDCVSRQEVDQNIYDYAESNRLSYANLKNAILDVPPVTPTRWIPISKTTLPKENEAVLITYKFSGKRITTKAYRQSNGWEFENGGWIPNELVVAWQPLPQPYEEKRGNENEENI